MTQRKAMWSKGTLSSLVAICLLLCMLLPLLGLAFYALPSADDYSNAALYREKFAAAASPVAAWFSASTATYAEWQGTYFSNFLVVGSLLVAQHPIFLTIYCIFMLVAFFLSLYYFIHSAMAVCFARSQRQDVLWVYTGLVFLMTQTMNLNETFYWYTGSVMYVIPFIFTLLAGGLMCRGLAATGKPAVLRLSVAGFLLFLACGGALVIGAFVCCASLAGVLYAFWARLACKKKMLLVFGLCLAFTLLNVASPGYHQRQPTGADARVGFVQLLFYAFINTLSTWFTSQWLGPVAVLFVLLALTPLLARLAKESTLRFPHPLPVLLYSFASVWGIIFPFAGGEATTSIAQRYVVDVQWFFVLILLGDAVCLLGWLYQRHGIDLSVTQSAICVAVASIVCFFVTVQTTHSVLQWNSYYIIQEYVLGDLATHVSERRRVLYTLEHSPGEDVVVQAPAYQTPLLPGLHLQADPANWVNTGMSKFFGNSSIQVVV